MLASEHITMCMHAMAARSDNMRRQVTSGALAACDTLPEVGAELASELGTFILRYRTCSVEPRLAAAQVSGPRILVRTRVTRENVFVGSHAW